MEHIAQKYHGKDLFNKLKIGLTRCFDDNFPCKIIECERKHVNNWQVYLLYLHMETDRTKFTNILVNAVKLTEPSEGLFALIGCAQPTKLSYMGLIL